MSLLSTQSTFYGIEGHSTILFDFTTASYSWELKKLPRCEASYKDEHSNGNQILFSSWFNEKFIIDAFITIVSMIISQEYLTEDFLYQVFMSP